jgi:hypothetical protein
VTAIGDLRFTPAPRRLARCGLLGWVAFTVADTMSVDGVAVRRALNGRLVLSFPARRDRCGREHPYLLPTCDRARHELERAILAELGLEAPR